MRKVMMEVKRLEIIFASSEFTKLGIQSYLQMKNLHSRSTQQLPESKGNDYYSVLNGYMC